ncbi:class I tRNA ligase family protein [Rhodocytophaga aerolata]|uniref:Leucine--tRNA ligase n=1 Tax=Rhodocytophaga aerolata TaxID=455078 RepID=A0ABT8R9Z8_9BACT|nr:class I tRNA ligase family protein [Rhodocytophaga aerolata]MDO1448925.1 class I tRNA ligase family protein [Rhodocytophaga aerolata]
MGQYNFREIEKKWQQFWEETKVYQAEVIPDKPKYYVLDMFPYPSGAGLHVGHPLGYIASDIVARYKWLAGYNVLHPMGFDSFGLPAEQYAIQTGQHPAITTEQNISRYIAQLKNIGFAYDWSKEVRTSSPDYYKWTQWIFMHLFNYWYNKDLDKAESIEILIKTFEKSGNTDVNAVCDEDTHSFTSVEWHSYSEIQKLEVLLKYRLTYLADTVVNWCPQLGTVLANEEVKDGLSERGGYPVVRKKMQQWSMRISAYAERLLQGLDEIDWPDPLKEMQRNWIGKSLGAEVDFTVVNHDISIKVFTTRPDTIFGVSFLVIAPESDLVAALTTPEQKSIVDTYVNEARNRSERDRMTDVKRVSGVFTGAYAVNPINQVQIPIWTADYVLAGYGTGAVMGVPSNDERDYRFATHFHLPIIPVMEGEHSDILSENFDPKAGTMINSDFLNGLPVYEALPAAIKKLEEIGVGKGKINYRMRDAIFSRQRYWGEPVPVYFKPVTGDEATHMPYLISEQDLPLVLPEIDAYLPTETGEPPLGRAANWKYQGRYEYELSTMPGWAGSSWYFFRYMDAHNPDAFCSKEAQAYWENVDLYIGGSEHATGHLLYSRFWTKFLYDLGYVTVQEPFKKLINQGMIQGRSNFVYRLNDLEGYAEELIWEKIKDKQLGEEFTQKCSDGKHKFDFLSVAKRLVIEIKPHKLLKEFYEANNQYLKQSNYHMLLVSHEEAILHTDSVVEKIKDALQGKIASPAFEEKIAIGSLFVSKNLIRSTPVTPLHVDVNIVENDILDIDALRKQRPDFAEATFLLEDGKYICGAEVEKMSKRFGNVVNPDDVVEKYGADTLRLYEMFLGPLEQSKPWNTNGISGVHNFLKKLWRLFHDEAGNIKLSDDLPTKEELKSLHKTIKKVEEDINRFSFNTSVSTFMICVNELSALKCNKRSILQDLVIVLAPYAPHIAEELWHILGQNESIFKAAYPAFNAEYLVEDVFEYPISVNGKLRAKMSFSLDTTPSDIEKTVLSSEQVQKWLDGKAPKKIIVVPKKIVNVVI